MAQEADPIRLRSVFERGVFSNDRHRSTAGLGCLSFCILWQIRC